MQPYDCPTCGAIEGGRHGPDCSLAGEMVAVAYRPPYYRAAELWMRRNRPSLERLGDCVVINAADCTGAVGTDLADACTNYKTRFPNSTPTLLSMNNCPRPASELYSWPWCYKLIPA